MKDYRKTDVGAIKSALHAVPVVISPSNKGRYFHESWWPAHYMEVEGPILDAISREDATEFDRRVDILLVAEQVDASNGSQLKKMGFSSSEKTAYVTRAMNKRLEPLGITIRNQKAVPLALAHKSGE